MALDENLARMDLDLKKKWEKFEMISMNEPATTEIEHISAWKGVELARPEVKRVRVFFVWTFHSNAIATLWKTRPECPIAAKDWFIYLFRFIILHHNDEIEMMFDRQTDLITHSVTMAC